MAGLRRSFLVTASMLALCSTASAGDWTGFYVGLNGGVTGNKGKFTDIGDDAGNGFFGPVGTKVTSQGIGPLVGAHVGYNWQVANIVYGLEGDWAWANGKSSTNPLPFIVTSTEMNSLATFRGRIGFATPMTLFYFTGGLAYAHLHNMLGNLGSPNDFESSGWRLGWVMGPGFEYMLGPTQSIRIEGLFSEYGNWNVIGRPNCVGQYRTRFSHSETTVRGAISVKW